MILFRSRNSARLVLFLPSPPTLPFDFALDFPDCEMVCGGDGVDESGLPYCMVRMFGKPASASLTWSDPATL